MTEHLDELDDEELGQLVRRTATFRAAAACAQFAEGVQELHENDSLAFDRLVDETHAEQSSSVQSRSTTREIVDTFLDVVQEHAQVADEPADAADRAAEEVVDP